MRHSQSSKCEKSINEDGKPEGKEHSWWSVLRTHGKWIVKAWLVRELSLRELPGVWGIIETSLG